MSSRNDGLTYRREAVVSTSDCSFTIVSPASHTWPCVRVPPSRSHGKVNKLRWRDVSDGIRLGRPVFRHEQRRTSAIAVGAMMAHSQRAMVVKIFFEGRAVSGSARVAWDKEFSHCRTTIP